MAVSHESNAFAIDSAQTLSEPNSAFDSLIDTLSKISSYCRIGDRFAAPFEAFYLSTRTGNTKSRVLPIFEPRREVGVSGIFDDGDSPRPIVSIRVDFFVAAFDSLARQLQLGGAPPERDSLLCPRFNLEEQFFAFEGFAQSDEYDKAKFAAYVRAPIEVSEAFIRIRGIASNSVFVLPSEELQLFTRCDDCDFVLERVYLSAKVMHSVNARGGLSLRRLAPKLPSTARWADALGAAAVTQPRAVFDFFCAKAELAAAGALLPRIVEASGGAERPRCFYVEAKSGKSARECLVESLANKLGEQRRLVFVMLGDAFTRGDVRHARTVSSLAKHKIVCVDFGQSDERFQFVFRRFARTERRVRLCDGFGAISVIFVRRSARGFKIAFVDFAAEQNCFVATADSASLVETIDRIRGEKCPSLVFSGEIAEIAEMKLRKVICRKSGFQLFPNIRKAIGFDDIRVNLQTFRSYLTFEKFFCDKQLEELYERLSIPIIGSDGVLLLSARIALFFQIEGDSDAEYRAELARALFAIENFFFPLRDFIGELNAIS